MWNIFGQKSYQLLTINNHKTQQECTFLSFVTRHTVYVQSMASLTVVGSNNHPFVLVHRSTVTRSGFLSESFDMVVSIDLFTLLIPFFPSLLLQYRCFIRTCGVWIIATDIWPMYQAIHLKRIVILFLQIFKLIHVMFSHLNTLSLFSFIVFDFFLEFRDYIAATYPFRVQERFASVISCLMLRRTAARTQRCRDLVTTLNLVTDVTSFVHLARGKYFTYFDLLFLFFLFTLHPISFGSFCFYFQILLLIYEYCSALSWS